MKGELLAETGSPGQETHISVPPILSRESKAREGQGFSQGPPQAGAGPSLVSLPPDTEIHPAGPSEWPSPDPFPVSRTPR